MKIAWEISPYQRPNTTARKSIKVMIFNEREEAVEPDIFHSLQYLLPMSYRAINKTHYLRPGQWGYTIAQACVGEFIVLATTGATSLVLYDEGAVIVGSRVGDFGRIRQSSI